MAKNIAPQFREYWLISIGGVRSGSHWRRGDLAAARVRVLRAKGVRCKLIHVTVLPRGSRRVVEAARKLEASWDVKAPRGEASRAFRELHAAVRAMGDA